MIAADAGIDDQSPVPTRAGSLRRGQRRVRGRRRHRNITAESAAGRISDRSGADHMNRIGEECERDPTYRSRHLPPSVRNPEATAGDAIADTRRGRSARKPSTSPPSSAGPVRARPRCRSRASSPNRRWSPSPRASRRDASSPWCGACTASSPRRPRSGRHDRRAASIAFRDRFARADPARHHRGGRSAGNAGHHQHGAYSCIPGTTARRISEPPVLAAALPAAHLAGSSYLSVLARSLKAAPSSLSLPDSGGVNLKGDLVRQTGLSVQRGETP